MCNSQFAFANIYVLRKKVAAFLVIALKSDWGCKNEKANLIKDWQDDEIKIIRYLCWFLDFHKT
jgi:hypothetical protein